MNIIIVILGISGGMFLGYKLCQLQNKPKEQFINDSKVETLETTSEDKTQKEVKTISTGTLEKSLRENKNKTLTIENGKFIPKEYDKLFLFSDYKEATLKKQIEKIKEYITIVDVLEQDLEEYLVLVGLYEGNI